MKTCANPGFPALLRDKSPNGRAWRLIDGEWTRGDAGAAHLSH